jgi:DNA polymerase
VPGLHATEWKAIHYQNAAVSKDRVDRFGYPVWTYWRTVKAMARARAPAAAPAHRERRGCALARELLVDAMFRFEERGFPVVMHCHDEIVVEHPSVTKGIVEEIMSERPRWAADLGVPVSVEAWVGRRYRK